MLLINMSSYLPTISLPEGYDKLLLHSCCAPCSCEIMNTLSFSGIDYSILFYNPNIDEKAEYEKRKFENMRFAEKLSVNFYDGDYEYSKWFNTIKGYENEPEKGARCSKCFEFRLLGAAKFAKINGFRIFTSSLGISRWKNFEQVCNAGVKAASQYDDLIYWQYNWRKKGGSERMDSISKEENFYRQNYCGCQYSKR